MMLLIVDLSAKTDTFSAEALKEVDAALDALGFRKEVHSVVKPGKEFSVTYDGPNMDKSRVEEILQGIVLSASIVQALMRLLTVVVIGTTPAVPIA